MHNFNLAGVFFSSMYLKMKEVRNTIRGAYKHQDTDGLKIIRAFRKLTYKIEDEQIAQSSTPGTAGDENV